MKTKDSPDPLADGIACGSGDSIASGSDGLVACGASAFGSGGGIAFGSYGPVAVHASVRGSADSAIETEGPFNPTASLQGES